MKATFAKSFTGYSFILPWLVGLVFFVSYPFLAGFAFSFCDYPPLKGPTFVGLDNYAELLRDGQFHQSLGVTMIYASVAIPLGVFLAVSLALLLNSRIRGQSFYRMIYYLPHLVPTVAIAILWMWIFNPEFGLLNVAIKKVFGGLDGFSGLFFNLPSAGANGGFVRPAALVFLALPAMAFVAWGVPLKANAPWRRFFKGLTVVGAALALVVFLTALLYRLMPSDMERLHHPGWLSDGNPFPSAFSLAPSGALWALIIMSMWGTGQMAVIYLAKLQDVPIELYEAADIDGAGWGSRTLHITLPMISPVILFNVVMAIIGTFQIFAEPYIMTGGGPEGKTRFVAMFVYDNAFQYGRVGYASAVAWALFLIIVALTVLAFRLLGRHVYYAGR